MYYSIALSFQEPWTDLLFVNKIDLEITESVRCWIKHALGPQKKPMDGKITGQWSDRSPETGALNLSYEVRNFILYIGVPTLAYNALFRSA